MAAEDQEKRVDAVQPGMKVEATEGDLGEQDVRPAHITHVTKDQQGEVKSIEVEKGILFRKKLEVPADRVQQVKSKEPDDPGEDVATVDVSEAELEGLHSIHTKQTLASEDQKPQKGLLDQVEQQIPTEQGLREKEGGVHVQRPEHSFWRIIGPGLLSGTSGNDSSAVTAYAIDGASAGYSHLWLMLLSTPLYQAVQFACAKIGRVSQKGLTQLLREHYGRPVAGIAALLLIITNVALIAADLVAIGSGLELITGLNWVWFVIPIAILLWYLTVFGNFEGFKKIFLTMSFVFVSYILTAFFARANWGAVLVNTFVPRLDWKFGAISSAVALLGATISPYSMFWQVQGEIEETRVGSLKSQLRDVLIDVGSGAVSGNIVAYFIIVTTSATLFAHQKTITTAADAARALEPLAGPLAYDLFAVGLVGSGIIAIPVLLASTSYTVTGAFGWPAGLSKRPWQNEGFYLILSGALLISMAIALLRIDPIRLIFWANIIAGIMAPFLVLAVLLVGNNRRIMRDQRLSWLNNLGLVLTVLILLAAIVLLCIGLLTG